MKKATSFLLATVLTLSLFLFIGCSTCNHVFVEEAVEDYLVSEANCNSPAVYHKSCKLCGELSTETFVYGEEDHRYLDGVCAICEEEKPTYVMYVVNDVEYRIKFGEYPQSRVDNEDTVSALNALAGELPSSSDEKTWTPISFYAETQEVNNAMWYKDIVYQNRKYRGVYFSSYKPSDTTKASSENTSYQYRNGYNINTVYWFMWKDIEWRVLTEDGETAFLLINSGIDAKEFFPDPELKRDVNGNPVPADYEGEKIHSNNYVYSSIRRWLNEDFYNTAFSDKEKAIIQETEVDNSARSSNTYLNPFAFQNGKNDYACENTFDKVFMLSVYEVTNPEYGFSQGHSSDLKRRFPSTDYAECMGLSSEKNAGRNTYFWLRSAYCNYYFGMRRLAPDGEMSVNSSVWHSDVAPGIALNIAM